MRLELFDPALLALAEEQRAHNVGLMKVTEAMAGIDNRTPSTVLQRGKVPYATGDGSQREMYLPGRTLEQLRDPMVSPMWAELHDLSPAILTVGTADWLLDESLLLANRLAAAGNDVDLAVYPEGPHGIESMPTELGKVARERIYQFLRNRLKD